MKTLVVAIGNSDDKLPQRDWSLYCQQVFNTVQMHSLEVHAETYSLGYSKYQNAVFVFTARDDMITYIERRLAVAAMQYNQDAIALMVVNETRMVGPADA